MSDDVVIRLQGVGKRYTKYDDQPSLLNAALHLRRGSSRRALWALRDVDLEVRRGECIGVVGRNGAGKSTMLQLASGVTLPTEGRLEVRGRVAPLVSVGVGFHPELTGRENVFLNGTILGLGRDEIARRFDDIVDFAEIPDFIDTPVKFYSSGMFVRLGFAVAIHTNPDILLVDEVLAVGDFAFQMKCFDRMNAIRATGTTLVVVTHNLNAVRNLCERSVLLHRGRTVYDGETREAISRYHELLGEHREIELPPEARGGVMQPGSATIERVTVCRADAVPTHHLDAGERALVQVRARAAARLVDPTAGVVVLGAAGQLVYADNSFGGRSGVVEAGEEFGWDIPFVASLGGGAFSLTALVMTANMTGTLDRAAPVTFYVSGRGLVTGVADLRGDFRPVRGRRPANPEAGSPTGDPALATG